MGDQPVTKAAFDGAIAALTAAVTAMTTQVTTLSNNINVNNHNKNIPNRGEEPIPVIRVRNNHHYIHESDSEYYERRYYKKLKDKLKDGYCNFKFSDSIYCCPFCNNKEYSLNGLLRHASRMAGNSRKTIKDIAKHSVLITYIKRYLKVDETFSINNDRIEVNDAYVVGKNQIIEDFSSSEVMETDEFLLSRFVNAAFINKPELCNVLPPPDMEEKLNLESEVQTEVKSKTVETPIDEEGVFILELKGSLYVNNNGMNYDIQTGAMPKIDEQDDSEKDENSGSSSFEEEEKGENHEVKNIGDNNELNSINFVVDVEADVTRKNGFYTPIVDIEIVATSLNLSLNVVATSLNLSLNANNMCTTYSSKNSQLHSSFSSTKQNEKKNYDDEGNWFIVLMYTSRSMVTQGHSTHMFRSLQRAKQKVAIKQMRENLVIKVKPVLSFYYDKRMSQYQAHEALYQDENSGRVLLKWRRLM